MADDKVVSTEEGQVSTFLYRFQHKRERHEKQSKEPKLQSKAKQTKAAKQSMQEDEYLDPCCYPYLQALADEYDPPMQFFETSAKQNINVDAVSLSLNFLSIFHLSQLVLNITSIFSDCSFSLCFAICYSLHPLTCVLLLLLLPLFPHRLLYYQGFIAIARDVKERLMTEPGPVRPDPIKLSEGKRTKKSCC